MSKEIGKGLQEMINDCNTIIINKETLRESVNKLIDELSNPKIKEEFVLRVSPEVMKLMEDYYSEYYNREAQLEEEIKNIYKDE